MDVFQVACTTGEIYNNDALLVPTRQPIRKVRWHVFMHYYRTPNAQRSCPLQHL